MGGDHPFNNCKPQPIASGLPAPARIKSGKGLENPLPIGFRDARAVVVDMDQVISALLLQADLD